MESHGGLATPGRSDDGCVGLSSGDQGIYKKDEAMIGSCRRTSLKRWMEVELEVMEG